MKWLQFFTPAKSMDTAQTKAFLSTHPSEEATILDVRQPAEYERSHIPGAVLIPLPELSDRLGELDPDKPTLVYCAVGGRSRIAAQMLAGEDFKKVINVSGGIKSWESEIAVGPQDLGVELFSGKEEPAEVLKVAYSLEQGLREFYLTLGRQTTNKKVKNLFAKLAEIELNHQKSIFQAYLDISGEKNKISQEDFQAMVEVKSLEGGLSTEQYLELFSPDLEVETDVISLAMSIEAQALDLYQRVTLRIDNPDSRQIVQKIANEEKAHLESLGKLLDTLKGTD
ncbi:sulfurtransferase [Desulfobacter hydrogenophilus]|uniref:Sulfurtransferase n=1 Tax=Desulfobacter hydrogenophilus TaxID=2291 RepID=A0A328FDA4_9BACT|nr:rhodanese-like domain-containing protein [Desulfobacter hydrogenophilus]NDY70510.1 sulfurtransferase [Desulfobacter hydrogenophilus]QBH13887.1 sulfurtransferase [Desulfobacter hydrogenophilus]RAM02116.1 sulfurtransferase [Desulfobacter hydrogenophilus]